MATENLFHVQPADRFEEKSREGGKFMSDTDESRAKLSSYSECTYFFRFAKLS